MAPRPNRSPHAAALLGELARAPREWRHGYDLAQATQLFSGTLYPLLMRLEKSGLLESRWEASPQPSRPRRHVYRITGEGIALADEFAREAAAKPGRRLVPQPS
jgi:PadR family transcriptional regulator, regulatory protein PadR